MSDTQLAAKSNPVASMRDLIAKYKPQMQMLLGKNMSVEQMFQIACMAMGRNPKLAECTAASVLGCVLESSRLRLQAGAGAGETWLIPFNNRRTGRLECQLIIDYRGIIKMLKRDAGIESVMAEPVYEHDTFDYGVEGSKPYLTWKVAKSHRGKLLGYFAACWNKADKLTGVCYKSVDEIEHSHRGRSKAANDGPWKTDYDAMCKKSVIRPLAKLNPSTSSEIQRAVALDELAELGQSQDMALLADPESQATQQAAPEMPARASEATPKPEAEPVQADMLNKVEEKLPDSDPFAKGFPDDVKPEQVEDKPKVGRPKKS